MYTVDEDTYWAGVCDRFYSQPRNVNDERPEIGRLHLDEIDIQEYEEEYGETMDDLEEHILMDIVSRRTDIEPLDAEWNWATSEIEYTYLW